MTLNAEKTVFMNVLINHRHKYEQPITLNSNIEISLSILVKFLGLHIDDHLNFSQHVDKIVSGTNSRLFLLCQLKVLGRNIDGVLKYYCASIR